MQRLLTFWLGLWTALGIAFAADEKKPAPAADPAKPAADEVAIIQFKDYGEVVVEFWTDVAPKTVENFKTLAKKGFYDGTASHRLIPGFMLQMGDPLTKDTGMEARWGTGDPGYKIKAEFNAKKHVRGVLSMARSRNPDSAGSQFFICFGDAPSLDGQYTGFGRLLKGEETLAKLEKTPITMNPGSGEESKPVKRVHVESIKIVARDSLK